MQDKLTRSFLQLLKISMDMAPVDSFGCLTPEEWEEIYEMAKKQSLIGVTSNGILKLEGDFKPHRVIRFNWLYATEKIVELNQQINQVGIKVLKTFNEAGFSSCVLKGAGIAQLYPSPLLRQSGDIDLWSSGKRKDIIAFVQNRCARKLHTIYHHIDGLRLDNINIEVHFTPSYMTSPFANMKLQKWFRSISDEQFHNTMTADFGEFNVPNMKFNRVFILLHILRHFLHEGIGLRQIMDWYYVLLQGYTPEEREETIQMYKKLKITNFAGATVYVLTELFDLKEEYQIVKPNEKYGRILLEEILTGGNFGKYHNKGKAFRQNIIYRGWKRILRGFSFFKMAPQEVIWIPYYKILNRLFFIRDYRGYASGK